MPGLTAKEPESAIGVTISPSQSSYFAGEPFSVTITFTNTRLPEAGPSKPSGYAHKRGAHSISSAPLARPPTSPGTPRSVGPTPPVRSKPVDEVIHRKGLIGKPKAPLPLQGTDDLPELLEQRRKRQLAHKPLSVSISSLEFAELGEGAVISSAPYSQQSFLHDLRQNPTAPHVSSPLARTDALPSNHPHARKQSVMDGQFTLDMISPTTSNPPAPYSPSSSSSTFSLALDPIIEGTYSPYPSTPAIGCPTIEPGDFPPPDTPTASPLPPSNSIYAYPPPRPPTNGHKQTINLSHPNSHSRTGGPGPPLIGLGQPSNPPRGYPQAVPRSAFASTFSQSQSGNLTKNPISNHELILYSYAQLSGTVLITPVAGSLPTAEQARTLNNVRSALLNRSVLGGGSMDISSSLQSPPGSATSSMSPKPRQRPTHSRSGSFSAGLLSMLSPSSLLPSITSPTPSSSGNVGGLSKRRSISSNYGLVSPGLGKFSNSSSSPSVLALTNGNSSHDIDPEEPLPAFEIQPAMLAVDLALAPGESRSYTYAMKLPENLPPTFRGKSLAFSYELLVGICRAGPSNNASTNSISKVMKVPIRMYNHVCVGRTLKPYDLLWPVNRRMDAGMPGMDAKVVEITKEAQKSLQSAPRLPSSTTPSSAADNDTLDSIREYAQTLMASVPKARFDKGRKGHVNGLGVNDGLTVPPPVEVHDRQESERDDENIMTGCREAVEILTRNPKKASYDVNKDGVKVATLTFAKSAYRLGETVCGVVELNERTSRARVLKLTAILESHESLPSLIASNSSAASRHLRRSHAEHHCSFTLNTLRTTFSLDIPSDASPAFQIRVGTPPLPATTSVERQQPKPGGLEWKVRLCLLVSIASEHTHEGTQGVRFKSLVREGPRGEWGSSWCASPSIAPLERPLPVPPPLTPKSGSLTKSPVSPVVASAKSWSQFFVSSLLYGTADPKTEREYHDGDVLDEDGPMYGGREGGVDDLLVPEGYDGIIPDPAGGVGVGVDYAGGEGEGMWKEGKMEMVECEVPVKVFPGNTAFKALDVVFDV